MWKPQYFSISFNFNIFNILKNINKELKRNNTSDIYYLGNKLNVFIHECVDFITTLNKNNENFKLKTLFLFLTNELNGDDDNLYFEIVYHFDLEKYLDEISNNFNLFV